MPCNDVTPEARQQIRLAAQRAIHPQPMDAFERFIGLDVHKRLVVACVLDAGGNTIHTESFACTREELERFARRWINEKTALALEATSNTWAVYQVLLPFGAKITVSNPMKTKAIASATVKTDKVDSFVLGQLLRCNYLPSVWVPDANTRMLRQLTGRRTALSQDRTAVKNRIHSVLAGELIPTPEEGLFTPGPEKGVRDHSRRSMPPLPRHDSNLSAPPLEINAG